MDNWQILPVGGFKLSPYVCTHSPVPACLLSFWHYESDSLLQSSMEVGGWAGDTASSLYRSGQGTFLNGGGCEFESSQAVECIESWSTFWMSCLTHRLFCEGGGGHPNFLQLSLSVKVPVTAGACVECSALSERFRECLLAWGPPGTLR